MSIYGDNIFILNENYFDRVFVGFKIKPHQNLDETLKKHEYPGYLNYINNCTKLDVLEDFRQDNNIGTEQIKKIRDRISKCQNGETKENKNYYKGIKKMYIDKGITVKDCDLTIKWFNDIVKPAINAKIKELKRNKK